MNVFKSKCRFKVEGANLTRLINRLSREGGIVLTDISRPSVRELCFDCLFKDRQKVIAYLRELCYNYTLVNTRGPVPAIKFVLLRTGLLIGGIMFVAAVALSPFFVAEIRVSGHQSPQELERVMDTLWGMGVRALSLNRSTPEAIEKGIYSAHKDTAFVQAKYRGMVLYVSLVKVQPAPVVMDTTPGDMVSDCDGKVTRLIVYQGTAQVKPGDTVCKGQILVAGYRESPDGTKTPVRAMGAVWGEAEIKHTHIFKPLRSELKRTGEFYTESYIDAFGAVFPVKRPTEKYAEEQTESSEVYIAQGLLLPWKLITITHYRMQTVHIQEDFDKVSKYIIEQAEQAAEQKAAESGRITGITSNVREGDSGIKYIDVTVNVEKSFLAESDI